MSMSRERVIQNNWWKARGSLRHRFTKQSKRVCLVCAEGPTAPQHLRVKG